jgi:outer membrane protein assembly factor BamD (BamD/ComL family)
LLAQAQRELASGDPDGALSTLQKHALRYPSGALSPERDAARVLAMCASGKRAQARPLAERFLSAHPTSPLAPRVRAACATLSQ